MVRETAGLSAFCRKCGRSETISDFSELLFLFFFGDVTCSWEAYMRLAIALHISDSGNNVK
jgi:hypothetical protein